MHKPPDTNKGVNDGSSLFVLMPGERKVADLLVGRLRANGGVCTYVGLGKSMEPSILPGDKVCLREHTGSVRLGWVVAFRWGDRIITHRVVKAKSDRFWARGDAQVDFDGPVPSGNVIGRVVGIWRDGRYHAIDDAPHFLSGFVYNLLMSWVRRRARRWPGLRRAVEIDLLSIRTIRRAYQTLGGLLLGDLVLKEDNDVERVLGALVSDANPLTQQLVRDVEKLLSDRIIKLIVARSSRLGRIGYLLLSQLDLGNHMRTGFVISHFVRGMTRSMGVGRALLEDAETTARRDGMQRIVRFVRSENVRALGTHYMGYKEVSRADFDSLPQTIRARVPQGVLFLEKQL